MARRHEHGQAKVAWETPYSFVYDRKFDVALRYSALSNFQRRLFDDELTRDDRLITSNPLFSEQACVYTPELFPRLLSILQGGPGVPDLHLSHKALWVNKAITLAKQNLIIQADHMTREHSLDSIHRAMGCISDKLTKLRLSPFMIQIAHQLIIWEKIVSKLPHVCDPKLRKLPEEDRIREQHKVNNAKVGSMNWKVWWSACLAAVRLDSGDIYIVPKPYLIMIHNKLCDIFSVLCLSMLYDDTVHERGTQSIIETFIKHGTSLSLRLKNKFFTVTSCIEGLVTGICLQRIDEWENDELLDVLIKEIHETTGVDLVTHPMFTFMTSLSTPLLHEIACLSKIWGHPYVSMVGGSMKIHKRTTEPLLLDTAAIRYCSQAAIEVYITNYINRHGRWPPVELRKGQGKKDPLARAMLLNKLPTDIMIKTHCDPLTMNDWSRVTPLPTMQFSELENIIPLLKDKTISVLRSEVMARYIRRTRRGPPKWQDTRLLLHYILSSVCNLDHINYLHKYVDTQNLEELSEYLVMRLVPKEKEHKENYRGFGVKTYEDRMRGLIQEKNVKKFLDIYSEEQVMTLNELEIARKLYAFRTAIKAYPGYVPLTISFDASGWNNKFRCETTLPVLEQTLDRIYGYPIFSKTHKAFENTLFYVPDQNDTFFWDGQQGGIEGLNQDTWVWVYLQQIRYALKDQEFPYHILCKGDDLRVIILLHPSLLEDKSLGEWKNEIVDAVSDAASKFGHEIKKQESYGSGTYLAFNKIASVGTIELPQTFRKIQKTYGSNNAFITTLDEYIASTLSNSHAAAKVSNSPSSCYFVGLMWLFYYLTTHSQFKNLPDEQLVGLSLVPSIMGGFPIIYLHNMYVRAESDLLSPYIHLVQFCLTNYPRIGICMQRFLHVTTANPIPWERLLKDPYSLNIIVPPLPSGVLRSFILPKIKTVCKNEDIKALIQACDSPYSNAVIRALASANVIQSKVFSAIYAALPKGILTELLRKFESGRSVLELLLLRRGQRHAYRVFNKVQSAEYQLQEWRCQRVSGKERGSSVLSSIAEGRCPAMVAQEMRDLSWKAKIEGVTMPPITHIARLSTAFVEKDNPHSRFNHFLLTYTVPTIYTDENVSPHWASSGLRPMLGHTTSTGNIAPPIGFTNDEGTVIKVKNLLDYLSWVTVTQVNDDGSIFESNIQTLITTIITTLTNYTPSDLAPFSSVRKSGTLAHHGRSPGFRESIVPNMLSNRYQMVEGTSDTHIHFRTSRDHYMMNFLHCFCHATTLATFELEMGKMLTPPREIWVITTPCHWCRVPIKETPIVVNLSLLPGSTPDLDRYKACRIDRVTLRALKDSYDQVQGAKFIGLDGSAPDVVMSGLGVVQEALQHAKRSYETTIAKSVQHRVTSEGHRVLVDLGLKTMSRTVGTTELKRVQIAILAEGLARFVMDYCLTNLKVISPSGIIHIMSHIDPMVLPWKGFLDHIHEAGRLGELIRYVSKLSKVDPNITYVNPESSSVYLGKTLPGLVLRGLIPIRMCRLTYFELGDSQSMWKTVLSTYKAIILNRYFIQGLSLSLIVDPRRVAQSRCIRMIILLLYASFDLEKLDNEMKKVSYINQWIDICPLKHCTVDLNDDTPTFGPLGEDTMLHWLETEYSDITWEDWRIAMRETCEGISEFESFCKRDDLPVIQGFVSDLPQCIEGVRSYVDDSDISSSDTETCIDLPTYPTMFLRIRGHLTSRMRSGKLGGGQGVSIINRSYICNKIILQRAHGMRPFGPGTSSVNKLMEVLQITSLNLNRMYQGLVVACLADGFGGFVNLFSHLTKGGTILYNTLPSRIGIDQYPYLAADAIEENSINLHVNALNSGYYDLQDNYNLEVMEESHLKFDIVTCDAEVPWAHENTASRIWKNVVIFTARNCHRNSLMIIKLHAGLGPLSASITELTFQFFETVFWTRPACAYFGGEFYMIATGRNNEIANYDCSIPSPSVRLGFVANKFLNKVWIEYDQIVTRKNRVISLTPNHVRIPYKLRRKLRCNAESKSQSSLGASMDTLDPDGDRRRSSLENIKMRFSILVRHQTDVKTLLLTRRNPRSQYMDQEDTHTHWLMVFGRLMIISGMMLILKMYIAGKHKIDEGQLRIQFWNIYSTADKRLNLPEPHSGMFKTTYSVLPRPRINYYEKFITGVRIGQQLVSYYHSHPGPRENRHTIQDLTDIDLYGLDFDTV